jgi:AraC family transcriptional regulator, positive regulator of tynA and feaB
MQYIYSSAEQSRDKGRHWQDVVSEVFCPVNVDIGDIDSSRFFGQIERIELGDVEIASVITDPEWARRETCHISKDSFSYYLFVFAGSGVVNFRQFQRECALRPNHVTLLDSSEPYRYWHNERVSSLNLRIPSGLLRSRLVDPSRYCGNAFPASTGVGRIVADLLTTLAREASDCPEATAAIIANNLVDLIASLFETDAGNPISAQTARWAILKRCMVYINSHFSDPSLSPRTLADAMGVSVRYVHKAFEGFDRSIGEYLLDIRLEKSRAWLLRPDRSMLSIKQIAFGCGFQNQSHFSTSFKSKFGLTPAELRRSGKISGPIPQSSAPMPLLRRQ